MAKIIDDGPNFDDKSVKGQVEQRLWYMMRLKQHRYWKYVKIRNDYKQLSQPNHKDSDEANYKMNTGFALVNAKVAELMSNIPEFSFLPMDEDAKRNVKVRRMFWNHHWLTSRTDNEISKIIFDSMKYGSGWGMEYIRNEVRRLKIPYCNSKGIIDFKEEEVVDYDGCFLEHIPWEDVYVNNVNLEKSTECIVVRHWDRDEFIEKFKLNPQYTGVTEENIPKGKRYYNLSQSNLVDDRNYVIVFNPSTQSRELEDIISEVRYYNKAKDQYIVLANGVWINPLPEEKIMPLPFAHKQLPLVCFIDHYIEDDAYCLGEYDITEGSRSLKNAIRSLGIEVIKSQFGFTTISPSADFEESSLQIGLRNFARVDKEDIGFYAPNINGQSLNAMELKVDEDITIETGIDFKGLLIQHQQTASATNARVQSAQKRINLSLKINAFNFYERLARLRMSNMEFYYDGKPQTISVKGQDITSDGQVEIINGGYGTFTIEPKYLKGKMNIVPIIDSFLKDSDEYSKQQYLELVQIVSNMTDPDTGKPLVNPKNLIEAGRGIIDKSVDLDLILEKTITKKSAEQVLTESGLSEPPNPMMDPNFIPPSQRSGAPVIMPSSPNLGK